MAIAEYNAAREDYTRLKAIKAAAEKDFRVAKQKITVLKVEADAEIEINAILERVAAVKGEKTEG